MPYRGEYASKVSHFDIVENPDVVSFLKECNYLREPSKKEAESICKKFAAFSDVSALAIPKNIIAIDGSNHEASIQDHLPSTKLGYVKIGTMLIDMAKYSSLRVEDGRFVDPFKVASLQNDNQPLTFTLPGANVKWKGYKSVQHSFRASLDDQLFRLGRFKADDFKTSLRSTLFTLASMRREMPTSSSASLKIANCPNPDCKASDIEVFDIPEQQYCKCGEPLFPSDCLRIWETVSETQSNVDGLNRAMMAIEHMMPVHYIRQVFEKSPTSLSNVAFIIDGPLAVFGNCAWLHGCIMGYINKVNKSLAERNIPELLMIGIQKTGQVVEYFSLLEKHVKNGSLMAVDDEFRYNNIFGTTEMSKNGFGAETYYGQDFLLKTESGRYFAFALPYPFVAKGNYKSFQDQKIELERYKTLNRAIRLIQYFESDLYKNAIVPVALAHRYTSISLAPGAQVLDLLTRRALSE
ncbi:MAG: DNA double-strand break repair nuclease NurA [Pseudobdellovibrionaceae bacterium]